ncbi:uncharacterized protein LOC101858428 [Aplysia californica]|uniref:Uncharacterized protein LOC101858428 n=1 Tax=Aplysia californica TaxID=6500 RepID=A0ABM1A584_APLCA|nr:uncharacterized protein LOC101858428 [Aplysia californica]XP_035827076.1 uncharacterized protein LOC101858428 [Aplysia californica]
MPAFRVYQTLTLLKEFIAIVLVCVTMVTNHWIERSHISPALIGIFETSTKKAVVSTADFYSPDNGFVYATISLMCIGLGALSIAFLFNIYLQWKLKGPLLLLIPFLTFLAGVLICIAVGVFLDIGSGVLYDDIGYSGYIAIFAGMLPISASASFVRSFCKGEFDDTFDRHEDTASPL